jgi:diadenosine tetraphosphate (Ap4A) HIT family hydrolase
MGYDDENVFAKILRGEIPCNKVAEDEHTLAFADINPARAVHVLVIPKGAYVDWQDFAARASADELAAFTRMIAHVAEVTGIADTGLPGNFEYWRQWPSGGAAPSHACPWR